MKSALPPPLRRYLGMSRIDRPAFVNLYTSLFSLAGVGLVVCAISQQNTNWPALLLFAGLAATAELLRVELFVSSRFSSVSVSGVVAMASVLAFGPFAGVLTHMASGLVTAFTTSFSQNNTSVERASRLRRSLFNIGMWAVSSALAGQIFVWAGGKTGQIYSLTTLVPFVLAAAVDVLGNVAILVGVIALQTGRAPWKIWQQDFMWSLPITLLGSILGGGGLALAFERMELLGVAVFCLPVLTTGYAFQIYAGNMRKYVDKLEAANEAMDQVNTELLETLGVVIDADDAYTYGHSAQVAIYTEAIGLKMNLPQADLDVLVKAALIHDVGKVGISDNILSKQGPLSSAEYEQLKQHAAIGAEILSRMRGLQKMVPLVRHHHERWDGRGYPDGLRGTSIPLGARILAVADSLDAMCSDRPYRPTRNFDEVEREMLRCAGHQFDPTVIAAFEAVVAERGASFFRNSAMVIDESVANNRTDHAILRYLKRSTIHAKADVIQIPFSVPLEGKPATTVATSAIAAS